MNVRRHSSAPIPVSTSPARERAEPGVRSDGAGRLRRSARLLRHGDFQRVYKQGRRHFGTHMTVFYRKREVVGVGPASVEPVAVEPAAVRPAALSRSNPQVMGPRIGFTVGRVLGGAVDRNRIRRRMREAVRRSLATLTVAVDVVINPKKSALTVDFPVLAKEVARAFDIVQRNETKPPAPA